MKPIEERVKTLVENEELLTIKEKSEIICLIECYKSADKLAQDLFKENNKLITKINTVIEMIKDDPDLYFILHELLKDDIKDEN